MEKATLMEKYFATVILKELFATEESFSIENTEISCRNDIEIPRRSQKTSLSE
jgi:hypothetical protein